MLLKVNNGIPVPPPPGGAPGDQLLPVPYYSQGSYRDLCWAACCEMVLQYNHAGSFQLCEIMSRVFNADCCTDPASYDTAVWPNTAYSAFGFTCQAAGGAMSPQSVQAWIAALYPVQPYFVWNDNQGSHTALIVGQYADGRLEVYDPKWGTGPQSYQYVLQGYGMGSWQDTWYDIVRGSNG